MVAAMPVLLLSGLVYGIYMDFEDKKAAEAQTVEETMADDEDNLHQVDNSLDEQEESPKRDSSPSDDEEVFVPSQEEMQNAQNVAVEFIKAFHSFDVQKPDDYLKQIKPYMTEDNYSFYEAYPKRGTLDSQKVKVTNTYATPGEFQEQFQIWNVEVTSENTDVEGKMEEIKTPYSVLLIPEGDEWKVDGVRVDE